MADASLYSKKFDYLTQIANYNFHATVKNIGDPIGGRGNILILKALGPALTGLIAVRENQVSIDNIYLTFDLNPTSLIITLSDLPPKLLICVWQKKQGGRVISVLSRLGTEYVQDTEVKRVWPDKKVAYVPYVSMPISFEEDDPLTKPNACTDAVDAYKSGHLTTCVPIAGIFNTAC